MNFLTYELSKQLGWATVILVTLAASLHLALLLDKRLANNNSNHPVINILKGSLNKYIPFIRSYHGPIGSMAFLTGITHGYALLESIELHSGYILWLFIVLLGISGALMKLTKTQHNLFGYLHKSLMYLTIALMIFHVITMQ